MGPIALLELYADVEEIRRNALSKNPTGIVAVMYFLLKPTKTYKNLIKSKVM